MRARWIKQTCDAWRTPITVTPVKDAAEPDSSSPAAVMRRHLEPDDAQARRERAYRNYCIELSRAWMQGRADPREADRIERQRRGVTNE